VLAVALDSTTLEEKNTVEDKLRPYAEEMRELLPEGEAAFAAHPGESHPARARGRLEGREAHNGSIH